MYGAAFCPPFSVKTIPSKIIGHCHSARRPSAILQWRWYVKILLWQLAMRATVLGNQPLTWFINLVVMIAFGSCP